MRSFGVVALLMATALPIELYSSTNELPQIECYRTASKPKSWGGLGLSQEAAANLCSGVIHPEVAIECYSTASERLDLGGLGLGQETAVRLCQTNRPSY